MHRFLILAILLLSACSPVVGEPGPQGAAGPQGPQGKHGINGEDGVDAAQDGSRLTARWINGADGSRQFNGDFLDTKRDEVCSFRDETGDLLCLPPILKTSAWNTFIDSDCTGDYGFVALYAPADFPAGSTLVHMLGGPFDGEILMRGEEVATLYTNGSGMPCQPLIAGSGFAPPYHHWPVFDPSAFVAGTVQP